VTAGTATEIEEVSPVTPPCTCARPETGEYDAGCDRHGTTDTASAWQGVPVDPPCTAFAPAALDEPEVTAEQVHQVAAAEHESVGAEELGSTYMRLLRDADAKTGDVEYTPRALAAPLTGFALAAAINQVGPEPGQLLRLVVCDPACGAGMFLAEAARQLSAAYARRLVAGEPSGDLILAVMPRVVLECVFGMDIDPVAVDLARLALSLETAGALSPAMLARHVICGDPLAGASPSAMDDRTGREGE
jgi:hypothetical protein